MIGMIPGTTRGYRRGFSLHGLGATHDTGRPAAPKVAQIFRSDTAEQLGVRAHTAPGQLGITMDPVVLAGGIIGGTVWSTIYTLAVQGPGDDKFKAAGMIGRGIAGFFLGAATAGALRWSGRAG